jgi:DNA-binding CsgD family transcriptional regulator
MNQTFGTRASRQVAHCHHNSARLGADMFSDKVWDSIARKCELSPRELQIVCGVFNNHTDHAIAITLGISRHTIHTYLSRLFRKLDANTRTQIVLRIMQQYLVLVAATDRERSAVSQRHVRQAPTAALTPRAE